MLLLLLAATSGATALSLAPPLLTTISVFRAGDGGCAAFRIPALMDAGDGVLLAALSKHTVGSYRALRATQEEGAAQEEGKRQYCDDRAKEVKPPRFRTLRRRVRPTHPV